MGKVEKALGSIENAISSRFKVAKMERYAEKIVPVEMETSGIRSDDLRVTFSMDFLITL